jgi:hypothetical protein
MKRIVSVLAALFLLTPTPALAAKAKPRPLPAVQLLNVTETCQFGWAWVTATVQVNRVGTYDVWLRDDLGLRLNDDGVTVESSGVYDVSLPNPEQVDVVLTAVGSSVKLAERSVAAAPCTVTW